MTSAMTTGGAVIGGIGVTAALGIVIGDVAGWVSLPLHAEAWATLIMAGLGARMHYCQKRKEDDDEQDESAQPAPAAGAAP